MNIDEFLPEFINNDVISTYFFWGGGQFMSINEVGSRGQRMLAVSHCDWQVNKEKLCVFDSQEVNLFMIRLLAAQETKSYTYFHNLPLLHPQRSSSFPSCTWPLQHYHNPPGFARTSCLQQLMGFSMKAGAEIVSPWQQPLPHLLVWKDFLDWKEQRWTLLSRNFACCSTAELRLKHTNDNWLTQ